ncbi:MAG TPA: TlpA disulfide reductase family protein [Solirubrobacteraceae bacterium]|jgi:cytochrome c biogenesis protein CcmG/thiol:disulfide interchange protein DsbE
MGDSRVSARTWVLLGVALVVVMLAVFGLAGKSTPTSRVARALPSERLAGADVTLASLRGHPALVTFWASWCEPCKEEAPALERFSRGLHGNGVLVGVNWGDTSVSAARAFIKRYGWSFPNLRDPEQTVGHELGVRVLPTTFLIDGEGRVRETLRGPQSEQSLQRALASVGG